MENPIKAATDLSRRCRNQNVADVTIRIVPVMNLKKKKKMGQNNGEKKKKKLEKLSAAAKFLFIATH